MRHRRKPRIYVTQTPSAARMVSGAFSAVANKRQLRLVLSPIAPILLKISPLCDILDNDIKDPSLKEVK